MCAKPIRVDIMRGGEVIYTSKSIVDASIYTNMSTTSIKHMLDKGMQIQGFQARYHQGPVIIPPEQLDAVRATVAQLEHEYRKALDDEKNAEDVLRALSVIRRDKARILNKYVAKNGKGE